jgi:2-keto-4-pentenoate hydratase/2-oxohepta-3-ene-1,7-dioic acid hydratase in catechol pathway
MAKYCRFEAGEDIHYGMLRRGRVQALSAAPWAGGEALEQNYPLSEVRLLAPSQPGKIVCLGRNFREHASELGNPVPRQPLIFLKPPSAVIGPEEAIVYPAASQRVDYEGELAMVIGRRCPPLGRAHGQLNPEDDPFHYVFGYTCLNDVTARDLQKADGHFARAKGFDTFCPLGPVIETDIDPANTILETYLNGERRQHGSTGEMIFSLSDIIRFVAGIMTLEPGDVIATGTPPGVGPMRAGDTVEVVVEGIGHLRNPVVAEASG